MALRTNSRDAGGGDARFRSLAIAVDALKWIVVDADRLYAFLDGTGLERDELVAQAGALVGSLTGGDTPGRGLSDAAGGELLGAVLDHLLADEDLLLPFCEEHGVKPATVHRVRREMPGATPERDLP